MKLGIKDTVGSRFSLDNKLFKSMGFLMPENVWWHRSALWSVVLVSIISFFCGVCDVFLFQFNLSKYRAYFVKASVLLML